MASWPESRRNCRYVVCINAEKMPKMRINTKRREDREMKPLPDIRKCKKTGKLHHGHNCFRGINGNFFCSDCQSELVLVKRCIACSDIEFKNGYCKSCYNQVMPVTFVEVLEAKSR